MTAPLLTTKYIAKPFRSRRWKLVLLFVVLASVFVGIGFVQHAYVHSEVEHAIEEELAGWAAQVVAEIDYHDKWDLDDYRNRSNLSVPSYYVVAQDGTIVDIKGLLPGVFRRVEPSTSLVAGTPRTVQNGIGESWRVLGRSLDGGMAFVGVFAPKDLAAADKSLDENIAKFGSDLTKAKLVRDKQVDADINFAVVNSEGTLVNASGGVPFKTALPELPITIDKTSSTVISDGSRVYRLHSEPIHDRTRRSVGGVIVSKDVTFELQALSDQDRFNALVVAASLLMAVALALAFVIRESLRRQNILTVDEALKVGESKTVEFKSTYRWDPVLGKDIPDNRLKIAKSIAGFLNADGGSLYIGVGEDRSSGHSRVCGLKQDLETMGGNVDKLRRDLTQFIAARVGTEFAPYIADRMEDIDGELCWTVDVKPSPGPAFVQGQDSKRFYVREGPRTVDLDVEASHRYIKNKWG